jgi:hypothetical protein
MGLDKYCSTRIQEASACSDLTCSENYGTTHMHQLPVLRPSSSEIDKMDLSISMHMI